jgi:hypothetical protein
MKYIILILSIFSFSSLADSQIRSSSGASCESSDFQPWEVKVGASTGDRDYSDDRDFGYRSRGSVDEDVLTLEISYSFGGVEPVDCNNFTMKVEREQEAYTRQLELKIQKLEQQLAKEQMVNERRVKFR